MSRRSRLEGWAMGDIGREMFLSGHKVRGPVSFSFLT